MVSLDPSTFEVMSSEQSVPSASMHGFTPLLPHLNIAQPKRPHLDPLGHVSSCCVLMPQIQTSKSFHIYAAAMLSARCCLLIQPGLFALWVCQHFPIQGQSFKETAPFLVSTRTARTAEEFAHFSAPSSALATLRFEHFSCRTAHLAYARTSQITHRRCRRR